LNLIAQQRYSLVHVLIKYTSFLWLWLYSIFSSLETLPVQSSNYHFANIATHFNGAYKLDVFYHMEVFFCFL